MTEFSPHEWDPYVVKYNDMQLCVLVTRGVRPPTLAAGTPEDTKKSVVVYTRQIGKWKRVWPQIRTR